MLKKINRKTFLEQYPEFIQHNSYRDTYIAPETFNSYILYVESGNTTGLCNQLSKELTKLLKLLKYESISFLGDTKIPWLYQEHDYKPVKQALDYLKENKISQSFNGAIQVDIGEVPQFIKHLFWLVRCNGIIIYAHFSDPDFNIMVSICQYGNIHFSSLNEETDSAFNEALEQTDFHILDGNSCYSGTIYKRYATFV